MSAPMNNDQALRLIDNHLKQCKDFDKDQRYMATSDIGALLNQGVKLDAQREKEVCDAILKQFDDTSIDVQSIAVRTVPLLVAKSQQQQVVEICSLLCDKMLNGEESVRNLYAIGLKTCVSNLPEALAQPVLNRTLPKLIPFIDNDTSSASVQDALEVINDLLARFGPEMDKVHDTLIKMAIGQLSNPNNLVRKRAIGCLGAVSSVASDTSLNKMVETILGKIDGKALSSPRSKSKTGDNVVAETIFVQAIGAIGRSAGNRLGAHINRIIPLLFRHLKTADDVSMQNAVGDDHRENIFQGLESFVLRCPNEMKEHLEEVYKKTAEFLVYDPNFNYGDSEDEEMDEGGSEEDDDDYSNFGEEDDDTSWKVRRAAAKVLNSIIISRPDALKSLYAQIQELLQKRFQERVESVRLDILEAYKSLLEATVLSTDKTSAKGQQIGDLPVLVRQRSTMEVLQQNLNPVVKSLAKLMREKSKHAIKTKIMSFQVMTKLVYVLNGSLDASQLEVILQPTVLGLNDKNSTLRLEALILCKTLLHTMNNIPVSKCETLKTPILKCIQADWFKIVAEALKCVSGLCRNIRPMDGGMFVDNGAANLDSWGSALCEAVMPRLKQHDIDQEIKNSAIDATGVILSVFGDHVGKDREKETLTLLLERTKNESSRLHALKALERCARSPAKLSEFHSVSPAVAAELATLLRQQSREIRQNALSAYIAMIEVAGFVPEKSNLEAVAGEMGNLIGDSKDSHLAHLALTFCTLAVTKLGLAGRLAVKEKVANQIIQIALSSASLLTGQAYQSLMILFEAMSTSGSDAGLGFNDLYPRLFPEQNDSTFWLSLQKPAMSIIAEACAVLLCACPDAVKRDQTIVNLVSICASPNPSNKAYQSKRHVAILILGEVGRRASLAMVKQPSSVDVVLQKAFDDDDEAVKVSAASSLGKLVVGDPKAFLPVVMKALEGRENKKHYLVLVSLRELVSSENASSHVAEWLTVVVKVLKDHCNEPNEEVRNMVAECFGKLAVLFPQTVIPELVSNDGDHPDVKWTKISGIRYAIIALTSCNPSLVFPAKQHIASTFRQAVSRHMGDKDNLEVSKAALMAVHALVHHTADLAIEIFPNGDGLIDVLYASTEVREELQKKVDFGPFKITVDDGLPLRKSAYSCLSALLENAQNLLGSVPGQLIPCIARGMNDSPEDAPDIPFLCHQILVQLCARYPLAVVSQSQVLMKSIQNTLKNFKVDGKDPEKQERKMSVVRSAVRTLDHVAGVPGALDDRNIAETVLIVQKTEHLKQIAIDEGLKAVFKKGSEVQ